MEKLIQTPAEFMADNKGQGSSKLAALISRGLNLNALRTNDILRKDEWIQFDQVLIEEAAIRLNAVADLISAGLTVDLPNALGTTTVQWETVSDMDPATRSMDGAARGDRDRQDFALNNIPVYITHKDFDLNLRHLLASRKTGAPIDTTQIQTAGRLIAESMEDALINGPSIQADGNTAYGYRNHPNRNTKSITDWSLSGTTGTTIITELIDMINTQHSDRSYGPYMLYVPSDYMIKFLEDFKTNSDKTVLQRILEIPAITDVKISDQLATNNVLLIDMKSSTVDLLVGEEPRTIIWDTEGGFILKFKVMAIMIPRVKADKSSRSGVMHATV